MPEGDNPTGLTHIAYWPDGMRMGWDGQKWVNLSPVDPTLAQDVAFNERMRQQGLSPQQTMQEYQKQLLPSQIPLGVQQEYLRWNPEPSPLGALASNVAAYFGAPDVRNLVAHPGESVQQAVQYWRQHPLEMAGRDINQVVNTVADIATFPVTFPYGVARSLIKQGPVTTAENVLGGPGFAENWAARNYGTAIAGAIGNAAGAFLFARGVPAAAMSLEPYTGRLGANIRTGALRGGQGWRSWVPSPSDLTGTALRQSAGRALLEGAQTLQRMTKEIRDHSSGTPDQEVIDKDPVFLRIMNATDETAINNAVAREPAMMERFYERMKPYAKAAGHPNFIGEMKSWRFIVQSTMDKSLRDRDFYVGGGILAASIGWKWVLGAAVLGYTMPFIRRRRGLAELYSHPFRAPGGLEPGMRLPLGLPGPPGEPSRPGLPPGTSLGGPTTGGGGPTPPGTPPGEPGGGYTFGGPGSPQAQAQAAAARTAASAAPAATAAATTAAGVPTWPWYGTKAGTLMQQVMDAGASFEEAKGTLRDQGYTAQTIPKQPPPPGTPPPRPEPGRPPEPITPSTGAWRTTGAPSPFNPRGRMAAPQVQEALRHAAADPGGQLVLQSLEEARERVSASERPAFDQFVHQTIAQSIKDAQESVSGQQAEAKRARSKTIQAEAADIADRLSQSAGDKPKSEVWRRIAAQEGLDPNEFDPTALSKEQLRRLDDALQDLLDRKARGGRPGISRKRYVSAPDEGIERLERVRKELHAEPSETQIQAIADHFEREWKRGEEIAKWLRKHPEQVTRYYRKYVSGTQ